MRGLKIASLGLLDPRPVLKNKQIIKSLREITRRSIFRKFCYSTTGLTHPNKNDKTILYIYIYLNFVKLSTLLIEKGSHKQYATLTTLAVV